MWFVLVGLIVFVFVLMFLPQAKGYRTMIFSWATGIIGAVLPFLSEAINALQGLDWRQYVLAGDSKNLTVLGILAFLAIMTAILRLATKGPVGEK